MCVQMNILWVFCLFFWRRGGGVVQLNLAWANIGKRIGNKKLSNIKCWKTLLMKILSLDLKFQITKLFIKTGLAVKVKCTRHSFCDSSFWTHVIVYIPPCPIIPLLEPLWNLWMDPRSFNFFNPSLMLICNGFDNEQPSRYNRYQSEVLCVHLQEYPFLAHLK